MAAMQNRLRAWTGLLLCLTAGCAGPPGHPPPSDRGATLLSLPAPASPPATAETVPTPASWEGLSTWQSLSQWTAARGWEVPRAAATVPVVTYRLAVGPHQWEFHAGSPVAYWNGVQIRLGFAPQWVDGDLWLHGLDLAKHVEPLQQPLRLRLQQPPRIVLDPGHGGSNTGTRSVVTGQWEKEYTLDWALRLGSLLSARGWAVTLTRSNDTDLPLTARVAIADAAGADVFLSLHFNGAAGTNHTGGLETYCLTPVGMPSGIRREFEDDPRTTFPNNAFDEASFQLAVRLHRAVLEHTGLADRGVRRARFMTVLQGQRRPAVLLEGGYLTSPDDARRIDDPTFRQRLAEAVASALP